MEVVTIQAEHAKGLKTIEASEKKVIAIV